jgi:hypothetical protein
MPRRASLLSRIVGRIATLCPPRHRDLVRGMVAELDAIADPAERRRFALGAIAAVARLILRGYRQPAMASTRTEERMARFWTRKRARCDKWYFRMVGFALLPALGVSITTVLVGTMLGGSESVVDRVSQIVFFPTFLAACHYIRVRQPLRTPLQRH